LASTTVTQTWLAAPFVQRGHGMLTLFGWEL
jgi:hypothetical protein